MKKVLYVLLIIVTLFVCASCKDEEVTKDTTHLVINEEVSNKKAFLDVLENYSLNIELQYSLVLYSLDIDEAYGQVYALYDTKGVDELNYPNYNAIATFTVYFEKNNDNAKIVDLLYTFPIKKNENENNLEAEYNLYLCLVKGILSNSTEKKLSEIFIFFEMQSKEDYLKIYNEEKKYDYKIIDMGENKEDYLSTLFLNDNKRITLEYHDSDFENDN